MKPKNGAVSLLPVSCSSRAASIVEASWERLRAIAE